MSEKTGKKTWRWVSLATMVLLWITGLWLLWSVSWKAALAVFLIGWALNIEQRLARAALRDRI